MRCKVSEHGLVVPKQWLEGIDEVEIRRDGETIVIVPTRHEDPIRGLGEDTVSIDVSDASAQHDRYIYGK